MSAEEWRAIPDWPGYEASDQGRVRSWRKRGARPTTPLDCEPRLLTQRPNSRGLYLVVDVAAAGRRRQMLVHRLVGEAFLGPLPDGMQTRHLNGDARDNRLENLRYGTHAENMADAIEHGTHVSLRTKARTHCSNEHEYATVGFYLINGIRVCRRCSIDSAVRFQRARQARLEADGQVTKHLIREWAVTAGLMPAHATGRLSQDVKWAFALLNPEYGWEPTPDPRRTLVVKPTLRDLVARRPEWADSIEMRVQKAAA